MNSLSLNSTSTAAAIFPFLHISPSTWSEPPQTSTNEGIDNVVQRLNFGCFFNSDANGGRSCDPIAFRAREEESLKDRIKDAVEKVQEMEDVDGVVDYIAQVLEHGQRDKSLYLFVKATVLEACDRVSDEVDCVCKRQPSERFMALLFLLAKLAKRKIIPTVAVIERAERVLEDVNRPYRIEGAIVLLIYPESGILMGREDAIRFRVHCIIGEMIRRRNELDVMRCKCKPPK